MKIKGRPESFKAEYFSHSVHESDALKVIVRKYKYEGYTAYFRLLEQVAKSDYHRIKLNNDTQRDIFMMNMAVSKEVLDFLFNLLIELEEMDKEQWEENQTIYLNKFVKQFRKLWYDRGKKVPKADGTYDILSINKENIENISSTRKLHNRIEYNSNNKIKESNDDSPLSFSEYEKKYPEKDLKFLSKYLKLGNSRHSKAIEICEREFKHKPLSFKKTKTGLFKAWCSKCGNQMFPNNDFELKSGSSCCRVEYTNKKPSSIEK